MTATGVLLDHTHPLSTLDPTEPLDDLAPLLDIVGNARVVAIGENNHHLREFNQLRHRILRLLVEQAGFTAYGLESGFAEGQSINTWVHGEPGDVAEVTSAGTGFLQGEATEVHDLVRWMRERNHDAPGSVSFTGLDLPSSAGSPQAALHAVGEYLRQVDPEAHVLLEPAKVATDRYAGSTSAVTMPRYAALDESERDTATAAVSRLLAHVEALRPVYLERAGREQYNLALHHIRGAWRLDQYHRELFAMVNGTVLFGGNSSRDHYMASTVHRLLDQDPHARLLLAVHNGHLQRVPFAMGGTTPMVPMGQHLATDLGADYVAIGMTCGSGTTTGLTMDAQHPLGFTVHEAPLPPPAPDSVEALLADSGPALIDLRATDELPQPGPQLIRHAETFVATPVFDAFDALVHVPTTRPSAFVTTDTH